MYIACMPRQRRGFGRIRKCQPSGRYQASYIGPDDKLYFLIGSDAFEEIETWHRWQDLVRLVDFIVVTRQGYQDKTPSGARIHRVDGLDLPVSSSDIRARLAAGQTTPELPASVRHYIDSHRLYEAIPAPVRRRKR